MTEKSRYITACPGRVVQTESTLASHTEVRSRLHQLKQKVVADAFLRVIGGEVWINNIPYLAECTVYAVNLGWYRRSNSLSSHRGRKAANYKAWNQRDSFAVQGAGGA